MTLNVIFSEQVIVRSPEPEQVYCQWGSWLYSECSTSCGRGTRTKTRIKLVNEVGTSCRGAFIMQERCNSAACTDKCP